MSDSALAGREPSEEIRRLVDGLNYAQKVARSLDLIRDSFKAHGEGLVVANSLGKDSCVVWDLAKRVDPKVRGFIVTTRFKPPQTIEFMQRTIERHPELRVFKNDAAIPDRWYENDPDSCCSTLKVEPTRRAVAEMEVSCWVTGLRCTEGRTRTDYRETEHRDEGLVKLNPILLWYEREIWQYLALRQIPVNPLYGEGYRSLGCAPCTRISAGGDERAGRWVGTSKCGGECGIHTRPLRGNRIDLRLA